MFRLHTPQTGDFERYPDLAARLVLADFFRAFAAVSGFIAANPCGISGASSPSSIASAFLSTSLGVSPVLSHRNKSGPAKGPSRKLIGSFIHSPRMVEFRLRRLRLRQLRFHKPCLDHIQIRKTLCTHVLLLREWKTDHPHSAGVVMFDTARRSKIEYPSFYS
jgi:hypothetical protein